MDAQKTGQLIAEARKEKGLTQRELAQALHVSAQAVSKWERGLNFPDLALLEPLGDCLGLSVSELLSGVRGEQPREELLRDSLRIFPAQTGAKVRRWRALALACLGVLLILALCGGYRYVKYHTELLPQSATVISPIARSELDTLAFQTAGLPSVHLYDLTVADGTEHYQVQMEYWTAEGLVRTWPVSESWSEDLPRRQQLAFSCQPQSKEGAVRVGVNLAGWSGQVTLEEVPGLERGYGLSALRQPCEVDPELGVVLACCSLTADGQAGWTENGAGEPFASFRAPGWTGAVDAPELYQGESCLLLRLNIS